MMHIYDTIVLAPHLDDAVLSCGGQIYLQTTAGQTVLIVTIMAGDPPQQALTPFAQLLHERWELAGNITAGRRAEDAAACAILGADYQHWELPDCIYRFDPQTETGFYVSEESLFGAVHPSEEGLVASLAERLRGLPPHGRLLAPLTIGNHVDHQIVRRAVETLSHNHVAYYEDYPYAAVPGALQKVLDAGNLAWRPEVIPLSEEALRAKIKAIAAYTSQVGTFFRDSSDLESMIRAFNAVAGGERIWHPA
jgi:LmbE family N-acetylglucosaminyl deacetylase